jgi:hypothetical protein
MYNQDYDMLLQKNLAYNITIIEMIWKVIKSNKLGENVIKGNENDFNNFYGTLERSRQTIREMKNMEFATFKQSRIEKWAKRIEVKTGIPYEYLSGKERIVLGKQFDSTHYQKFEDFLEACDCIDEQLKIANEKPVHRSSERIKKYVKEKGSAKQIEKFEKIISEAESALAEIKVFNDELKKEIKRLSCLETINDFNEDVKLFKLFYFVNNGKRYTNASMAAVPDVIKFFEKTRTWQLKDLGKNGLKNYIEALEEHLALARAVYTVAVDCGDFKN